ncbi:hypothetical protein YB2330_006058 [Saitoella coloradoensis]
MLIRQYVRSINQTVIFSAFTKRAFTVDHRTRLSTFFVPQSDKVATATKDGSAHALLVKAGYLRQAAAGIYQLLPLGLRVQDKIERLVDRAMRRVGASKVALANLSSSDLWKKTGRWEKGGDELIKVYDRKDTAFCLAPTHEEDITNLVANEVSSYRHLPVRLYQIGRKFRDERRPRFGLLRGREFVMKDLYTFDASEADALKTYDEVTRVYRELFDQIGVPYLVAEADSGNIGGSLSHEYHYMTKIGEDTVLNCKSCGYTANDERAITKLGRNDTSCETMYGLCSDNQLVAVHYPSGREINAISVRKIVPTFTGILLPSLEGKSCHSKLSVTHIFDENIAKDTTAPVLPQNVECESSPSVVRELSLIKAEASDPCPKCSHALESHRVIELGHTFHLGTKYSAPLGAKFVPEGGSKGSKDIIMGCHGLGISRMVAAIAEVTHDSKGLSWPVDVAPFKCAVIPGPKHDEVAEKVYDKITQVLGEDEVVLDERSGKSVGWKMKDADLAGYPFIVVVGKAWDKDEKVEFQVRKTGEKRYVTLKELGEAFKR